MNDAIKDAVRPLDAGILLGLLPDRPRLLALGEPTHGEDVLLEARNDLLRQLVEQEGYRTVAIESDCMMGLLVDDYVTTGTGSLDDVMAKGFSHGFGASAANRELVRWMRAYNDGRPRTEQLRFAGFDGPLEMTGAASPRQALTALHAYLAARVDAELLCCTPETLDHLLGADDPWSHPDSLRDPARSVGQSTEARQLRLLADDLAALLDTQLPHLVAVSSPDELDRARLYARTATGLLRYHFWLADTSPGRLAQLLGVRATMMAANLLAAAEHGPALAYAHNSHLQRERSSMRLGSMPLKWWSAGSITASHLGPGYAFVATALGTIRHHGVDTPPPDTLEGLLYTLPDDRCTVDPRLLAAILGEQPPAPRTSPWYGYAPLDPAQLGSVDAMVFVKDCPAGAQISQSE
ncbi:erythromycin esterase family protein [Catellatospora sp. KI3]|uniref:erythromycin esterase family protein n=1 Tax=Catellatospora sp. KI3 TaxID=3041620 RepID=UPI002482B1F1|nr:erythromycin esterase family protein [Catellatospora sp. KI3]MDI1460620.1 erythromycin esterase family protein [Catellatospora sp. KI3]